jgi:hypothetical protein
MSPEARACPHCGAPNKRAVNLSRRHNQSWGCLLILAAIPLLIFPPLAVIAFLAGCGVLIYGIIQRR